MNCEKTKFFLNTLCIFCEFMDEKKRGICIIQLFRPSQLAKVLMLEFTLPNLPSHLWHGLRLYLSHFELVVGLLFTSKNTMHHLKMAIAVRQLMVTIPNKVRRKPR